MTGLGLVLLLAVQFRRRDVISIRRLMALVAVAGILSSFFAARPLLGNQVRGVLIRPGSRGPAHGDAGTGRSSAGLRSKNPSGRSVKPTETTGITGQSSSRGMWVPPKVYQTTRSRSAARGRP